MELFLENLFNKFLAFISQYSFFIDGDYYSGLFEKYFSAVGFIVGFIFVLLVFFSSAEEQNKAGFFKVLPIIAVINSCTVISTYAERLFGQGYRFIGFDSIFNATDNIISGFILTLVISSCYRGFWGRAFLFGISTYIALPMLNYLYFEEINDIMPIIYIAIRVLLIGFICSIISCRKKFSTGWIIYFIFHVFTKIGTYFLPLVCEQLDIATSYKFEYSINGAFDYLSLFVMDLIVFLIVLVFAVFFEKSVLKNRKKKRI